MSRLACYLPPPFYIGLTGLKRFKCTANHKECQDGKYWKYLLHSGAFDGIFNHTTIKNRHIRSDFVEAMNFTAFLGCENLRISCLSKGSKCWPHRPPALGTDDIEGRSGVNPVTNRVPPVSLGHILNISAPNPALLLRAQINGEHLYGIAEKIRLTFLVK